MIKKKKSQRKLIKSKKPKTSQRKVKKNLIFSIPTEVSLEKKDLDPAEINNQKLSCPDQQMSFFQEHLEEVRFNPFDDFTPNDSLMVPDFFYPNDDHHHLGQQLELNFVM